MLPISGSSETSRKSSSWLPTDRRARFGGKSQENPREGAPNRFRGRGGHSREEIDHGCRCLATSPDGECGPRSMGWLGLPFGYMLLLLSTFPLYSSSRASVPGAQLSHKQDMPAKNTSNHIKLLANRTDHDRSHAEKCWSCKIQTARRGTVSADGLWLKRICHTCAKGLATRPLQARCKRQASRLPSCFLAF